jgi:hypothetical protein
MNIKKIIIGVFALFSGYIYGQNAYSMSVKNDMLSFSTINDYKTVVGGLEQEQKITFFDYLKKNMDFNSLAKNPNSELYKKMNDDFFEFLVNNEGYISIGENVYKLNPVNSVVVVIPSNKFDTETKAKVDISDYSLPFLRVYSMEDDVLGMVETNTPPSNARYFCGESGAGGDSKSGHIECKNPSDQSDCNYMDCWVIYNRLGLYFALKAKCINTSPCREMVWHKTPAGYKVKCAETSCPSYQWDIRTNTVGSSGWVWNQYFYQNARPLNAFWLRVVFMAKDPAWIGNPDNPSVDLEIRKNM